MFPVSLGKRTEEEGWLNRNVLGFSTATTRSPCRVYSALAGTQKALVNLYLTPPPSPHQQEHKKDDADASSQLVLTWSSFAL